MSQITPVAAECLAAQIEEFTWWNAGEARALNALGLECTLNLIDERLGEVKELDFQARAAGNGKLFSLAGIVMVDGYSECRANLFYRDYVKPELPVQLDEETSTAAAEVLIKQFMTAEMRNRRDSSMRDLQDGLNGLLGKAGIVLPFPSELLQNLLNS